MSKFTAEDARKLAGPSVNDHVDDALNVIREAAIAKRRSAALHSDFWVRGGYSKTQDWKTACKMLEDLGFKVNYFYEELQFVNAYTTVEW